MNDITRIYASTEIAKLHHEAIFATNKQLDRVTASCTLFGDTSKEAHKEYNEWLILSKMASDIWKENEEAMRNE